MLRPFRRSDYKEWFAACTGHLPAQSRWDRGPAKPEKCTRQAFQKRVQRWKQEAKNDDCYMYAVFEKKTGRLIGGVDFDIFVRGTHQFANFGYLIFNRYWGQGFGQEAASAGLKIGFRQLKLQRLEAAIHLDNKKSIRLVKAIGMRREGIKKKYWFEDGKWVDHLIYVANPEDIGLKPTKPKGSGK